MKNSKFDKLFHMIMQSYGDTYDKTYEYDTECIACGYQFCLNDAEYDDELDSYICPYCGSDHLVEIEIE